jgi:hypothetical protein
MDNKFKQQAQFEQDLAAMRDAVPMMLDMLPHIVKLHMEYYKALIKQGFTPEQALYLVGVHGSNFGIHGPS